MIEFVLIESILGLCVAICALAMITILALARASKVRPDLDEFQFSKVRDPFNTDCESDLDVSDDAKMVTPLARADDRTLIKQVAPFPDIDPIDELIRIVNEVPERDAEDERRLDHLMRGDRPSSCQRRRPDRR